MINVGVSPIFALPVVIPSAGHLPHNRNHIRLYELNVSGADHCPLQFRAVFQILERQLCDTLAPTF